MDISEGFGFVFYFFDDPKKIAKKLLKCFEEISLVAGKNPTRIQHNSGKYRKFNGSIVHFFNDLLLSDDSHQNSQYVRFSNASSNAIHDFKLVFMARKIEGWFPKKTPNYIYFETTQNQDTTTRWNFFKKMYYCHTFYSAAGDACVCRNDETLPRSGSKAVKYAIESLKLQEPESTWLNNSYMEKTQIHLEGPSKFVGLGSEFRSKVQNSLLSEPRTSFHFEFGEDYVLLQGEDGIQRSSMNKFLNELYCEYDKPQRFWKQDQWDNWRTKRIR